MSHMHRRIAALDLLLPFFEPGFDVESGSTKNMVDAVRQAYRRAALSRYEENRFREGHHHQMMDLNGAVNELSGLHGEALRQLYRDAARVKPVLYAKPPEIMSEVFYSPHSSLFSLKEQRRMGLSYPSDNTIKTFLRRIIGVWYWERETMKLKVELTQSSVVLTDLDNALRHRRDCSVIELSQCKAENAGGLMPKLEQFASRSGVETLDELFCLIKTLEKRGEPESEVVLPEDGLVARFTSKPGMRVFSPYALHNLNPLKKAPERWTYPHLIRLLANGQYQKLRVDFGSGEYALDPTSSYGRRVPAVFPLLARLIEEDAEGRNLFESANTKGKLFFGRRMKDSFSLSVEIGNRFPAYSLTEHDNLPL